MWPLKTFALCCISVLLLSGIVDAAPNRAKKGMIAYEESFDNVLTLGKAKSKQTRCHIRYDLERHILEVGFCDVKNVGVYTSDSIWLDDLHDPEGATNFEKGYTYRGVETHMGGGTACRYAPRRRSDTPARLWRTSFRCPSRRSPPSYFS